MPTEPETSPPNSVANEVRACIVAHARGALDLVVLTAALKGFASTSADAAWEILSLLDQYHRRGALSDATFNSLKEQVTPIAFTVRSFTAGVRSAGVPDTTPNQSRPANARRDGGEPTTMRDVPAQPPSLDDTNDLLMALAEAEDAVNTPAEEPIDSAKAHTSETAPQSPGKPPIGAVPPHESSPSASAGVDAPSHSPRTTRQAALLHAIAPGKILGDRFIIEAELSYGRYTAVFCARERSASGPHKFVALKILLIATPDSWTQFEHEQQVAQRLSHPQLVNTHEMQYDNKLPFFTMELIEGNTLGELLKAAPPRRDRIQLIIARLVTALKYLHQQQLAHGDLHPGNVMIATTGEVKLIDYGAMNFFGSDPHHRLADVSAPPTASLPDAQIYASCQRLEGEPAGPSDDIFSLSCIAYELLAGHPPFKHLTAMRARTLGQQPAPIPFLQPQQWHTLQRGLAWEREDRIASVAEWFAGFCSDNDMALKQPMPAPEAHEAPVFERMDTSPRWTPPVVEPLEPSPSRLRDTPTPRRRWPLVLASICSTIAVMVILQSELGRQLRADLAGQWARMQMPAAGRAELQPPSATPASNAVAIPADINTAPNDNEGALSNAAVAAAATSSASSTSATNDAGNNNAASNSAQSENTVNTDSVVPTAPAISAPAVPFNDAAKQANGKNAVENAKATQTSDAHGKVSFSSDTFSARKNDRYVPITIYRSNGTAGKVTFVWWTESGSAEEGADYLSYGRKTEVLESGKRRITVFVPLMTDLGKGKGHVFFVNLGDASNGLTLGPLTRAKVVIADE